MEAIILWTEHLFDTCDNTSNSQGCETPGSGLMLQISPKNAKVTQNQNDQWN